MLRFLSSRILWGVVLVLGGIALLLQNLDIFKGAGSLFWSVVFLLAGAAFFSVYIENHLHWWAFIPAFTLVGLGLSSLLDLVLLALRVDLGGTLHHEVEAFAHQPQHAEQRSNAKRVIADPYSIYFVIFTMNA